MTRLFAAVALGCLLFIGCSVTNNGDIAGIVYDHNGALLQGVQVTTEPATQTSYTDSYGAFSMYSVSPGSYTLVASHAGEQTYRQSISVTARDVTQAVIHMVKAP